jgi:hypothetical protein
MDGKILKPQFNVSLFNKQVHVILNQKFVEILRNFISATDSETKEEWSDVADAFAEANATKCYRSDGENPEYVITEFNGVYTVSMEAGMADQLSKLILTSATDVCKSQNLDFNAFIAFGRRLETAARGDFEGLQTNPKARVMQFGGHVPPPYPYAMPYPQQNYRYQRRFQ